MHFIEIKKFTYSDIKKLTKLGTWAAYFSNCGAKEMEVLTMNNTVMKNVEKAEHAFTSDETMRYQYMLWEGIDVAVIAKITSCSVEKIQQIADKQPAT